MARLLAAVSDGAPGLIRAIEECFPRSARQRCLAHKLRNLQSKVPEDQWPEFKARAIACYQAASPALARMLRDDIAATYGTALPSALTCLQDDFEACIAHLRFPLAHRRSIRPTDKMDKRFFLTQITIAEIAVRPFFCSAAPRAIVRSCSRHSNICFLGS